MLYYYKSSYHIHDFLDFKLYYSLGNVFILFDGKITKNYSNYYNTI